MFYVPGIIIKSSALIRGVSEMKGMLPKLRRKMKMRSNVSRLLTNDMHRGVVAPYETRMPPAARTIKYSPTPVPGGRRRGGYVGSLGKLVDHVRSGAQPETMDLGEHTAHIMLINQIKSELAKIKQMKPKRRALQYETINRFYTEPFTRMEMGDIRPRTYPPGPSTLKTLTPFTGHGKNITLERSFTPFRTPGIKIQLIPAEG